MKRAAPWLMLAALLAAFLAYLGSLRLADNFGRFHDDTLYFSSAQALAQGRGYILPSVPGTPPQTKYPILYSWLLSWVWKLDPVFPANVGLAVWITAVFACWFLVAAFVSLRDMGDALALALVALCAFQPHFLFVSGSVLSDVPFMALALTAAVVGERAFRAGQAGGSPYAVAAGILAGLSVLTRSVGVAVVAGLAAAAIHRRAYRQGALFCLAAAPFLLSGLLRAQAPLPSGETGWRQTWLWYSTYSGYF
ncbi:MAG: hypothetical protein HY238_20990, partial [Acidobacteria bacterium]|nr:hypothetical protein [Acidobacteriota bacterium]